MNHEGRRDYKTLPAATTLQDLFISFINKTSFFLRQKLYKHLKIKHYQLYLVSEDRKQFKISLLV